MGHGYRVTCGRAMEELTSANHKTPPNLLPNWRKRLNPWGGSVGLSPPGHRWRPIRTGRKRRKQHLLLQENPENTESTLMLSWWHYRMLPPLREGRASSPTQGSPDVQDIAWLAWAGRTGQPQKLHPIVPGTSEPTEHWHSTDLAYLLHRWIQTPTPPARRKIRHTHSLVHRGHRSSTYNIQHSVRSSVSHKIPDRKKSHYQEPRQSTEPDYSIAA